MIQTCGEAENRRRWIIKSCKVNEDEGGELGLFKIENRRPLENSIIELKPSGGGFLLEPSRSGFESSCHCCEESAEELSY